MKSIDEIVAAAEQLKPDQFLSLRKKLDKIESRLWDRELSRGAARMKKVGVTDLKIDRIIARRRREGRR